MTDVKIKVIKQDGSFEIDTLSSYCLRLSKKNNSVLYLFEDYLGKKLLDDPKLSEIRNTILTISADIAKLSSHLLIENGDENESL